MPIQPHYAETFRCIGSDCEDNCCRGWAMIVDQASYERYRQVPALSLELDQYLVPLTKDCSPSRYAMIRTNADARCPFLGTDKLCSLHKHYGPGFLCHTCATYPRALKEGNGHALWLSCPEAARVVLLNPNLMPELPAPGEKNAYSRFLEMNDRPSPTDADPLTWLWDLREFVFILLRDRSYPLYQRLFLLGMFTQQLDEALAAHQAGLIPRLLHEYAQIVTAGVARPALDVVPARASLQLHMVVSVIRDSLAHTNPLLCALPECLNNFTAGLQLDSAHNFEGSALRYADAHQFHYEPFMRQHPHILENYLINHILSTGFPFSGPDSHPQKDFIWMCVEFALIKGLLIGIAAFRREAFAAEHVVKLVQSFTKAVEHQPAFREAINWEGIADPEVLSALLKNGGSEGVTDLAGDDLPERRTMLEPVA